MKIEASVEYQVQGNPQSIDKTLNQAYMDAIKEHINLLEEKKRMFEEEFLYSKTTDLVKGVIQGLNLAIEQLYSDINQLKDKLYEQRR